MIEFDEEVIERVIQDGGELFRAHYREVDPDKDQPLDPDFQQYEDLWTLGHLRVYTARSDLRLVGYAIFIIVKPLHCKRSKQALQDLVYLLPEFRKGLTGLKLIRYAEAELARDGVDSVLQYAYRDSNLARLLQHMGYKEYPQVWFKQLRPLSDNVEQ